MLYLVPSKAICQTYHPIPTSDVIWIEEGGGFECSTYHQQHKIDGDTLIGGFTYHKIQTNGWFGYFSWDYNEYYSGCFRNDTINKKVYFVWPTDTEETLIYDFDLSIGDLVPQSDFVDQEYTVVDIDSILISGSFHKRYKLGGCDYWDESIFPASLIEGIGCNYGLLAPVFCSFECGSLLTCFYMEDELVYHAIEDSDCFPLEIEGHKEKREISVFPNPTEGEFSVRSSDKIRRYELYNSNGQIVLMGEFLYNESKLNVSNIPAGLYNIRLFFDDLDVQNQLILKN